MAATICVAFTLLFSAPTASAALVFGGLGSGAGQTEKPEGIAVDRSSGSLYVADKGNNRIDVFDTSGNFIRAFGWGVADGVTAAFQSCGPGASPPTTSCFKGIAGAGAGQLRAPVEIAVDNDVASASHHDIYVVESSEEPTNVRVQKFDPEGHFLLMFGKGVNSGTSGNANLCTNAGAPTNVCGAGSEGGGLGEFNRIAGLGVGPSGTVYVADKKLLGNCSGGDQSSKRVQTFDSDGHALSQVTLALPLCTAISAFAVDSNGFFYMATTGEGAGIGKYEPDGTLLYSFASGIGASALGVDTTDDLYAVGLETEKLGLKEEQRQYFLLSEYSSASVLLHRFGYGIKSLTGLAPHHTAEGDVFGSVADAGVLYFALPEPGPVVAPPSVKAKPVGSTKATLQAEINPEGKASSYHFEYVSQKGFEEQGNSFVGGQTKSTPVTSAGSADFVLHGATAQVGCPDPDAELAQGKCLTPDTAYRLRVIATNADGTQTLEGAAFKTLPPLEIPAAWATEVGTDAATIHAEVNPLGSTASGHFEYVEDAAYQQSGFAEATRVPASGSLDFGAGEAPLAKSATLYPLAPGTTYHYRLVASDSFATVEGPEHTLITFALAAAPNTDCPNQAFRNSFSSTLPDCRAYEMVSPLDKNNSDIVSTEEGSVHAPTVVDESSLDGGKLTYSSATAFGGAEAAPWTSQYLASRTPGGWSNQAISPPRSLPVGSLALWARSQFKAFSPDLCSGWLISVGDPPLAPEAIEDFPNLYRRDYCGEGGYEALTTALPPHRKVAEHVVNEYFKFMELQGVSADGSHAIYAAPDNLTPEAPANPNARSQLYERAGGQLRFLCILPNGKASTQPCSAGVGSGANGLGSGLRSTVHNAISSDGSRVYWTAAEEGPGTIYLRENADQEQSEVTAGKCTEPEKACTVAVSGTVTDESARYWAAAADGSKAIFSIEAAGSSLNGNLYEFDAADGKAQPIAGKVAGVVGASEDASRVYFVSSEMLSGANSQGKAPSAGKPNLYLYDAGEGGNYSFIATLASVDVDTVLYSPVATVPSHHAARVSGNGRHLAFMSAASPTGYDNIDAANGEADAEVYLYDAGSARLTCASCNPSGARPLGRRFNAGGNAYVGVAAQIPAWQSSLYATRVLSDDGSRLFFESTDALLPADTNGAKDVYEWEAPGGGDCSEESPAYFPANEGCIALISSGQSPSSSEILDASPDGSDVFITTASSLLPQDYGLVDIYDARAGGGYPPHAATPPACEGEACQGPLAPPNDPTPASSSFQGAGNVVEAPKKKTHKAKKKKAHKKKHKRPRGETHHNRRARR